MSELNITQARQPLYEGDVVEKRDIPADVVSRAGGENGQVLSSDRDINE